MKEQNCTKLIFYFLQITILSYKQDGGAFVIFFIFLNITISMIINVSIWILVLLSISSCCSLAFPSKTLGNNYQNQTDHPIDQGTNFRFTRSNRWSIITFFYPLSFPLIFSPFFIVISLGPTIKPVNFSIFGSHGPTTGPFSPFFFYIFLPLSPPFFILFPLSSCLLHPSPSPVTPLINRPRT